MSRGPGPVETEQDDPLVELARLVSRRPLAETPAPPSPAPAEAPPPVGQTDLSADLEAELLSTLEASLAEALAAENYDVAEPARPPAAPQPAEVADSGPRYAALHLGSAMEERTAARPLRQPANTDAPPADAFRPDPAADQFGQMALRRPARTTGPAYNPNALGAEQPRQRATSAPPPPPPPAAPPPAPSRGRERVEHDPFEVVARHELDESGARHVHLDFHVDVPVFNPAHEPAGGEATPAPRARTPEPPPQALFEHRPPYVAPPIHDGAQPASGEIDFDEVSARAVPEAGLRRAGVRPRRRRGSVLGTLVFGLILIGGAAAVFFLRGEGTSGDGEPVLIAADTTPLRVIAPEPVAEPGPGGAVFDRVNPGEAGVTNETLRAPAEPAVNIAPPAQPADGITQLIQPDAVGAANAVGAIPEPRVVRTVTVLPDGTILENGIVPPAGATPPANIVAPPVAPPPVAATNPPDVLAAAPPATTPIPAPTPTPAAPVQAAAPVTNAAANLATPPVGTPIAPGFYVQVASQGNEAAAHATISDLRARVPSLLGNRPVVIQRAEIPQRGTFYRVQFGPAASEADAQTLCNNLRAVAIECIIARNN